MTDSASLPLAPKATADFKELLDAWEDAHSAYAVRHRDRDNHDASYDFTRLRASRKAVEDYVAEIKAAAERRSSELHICEERLNDARLSLDIADIRQRELRAELASLRDSQ